VARAVTDAWADLTETFARAELPPPPIPAALLPSLTRYDRWHWGTRDVDRWHLYMLGDPVLEEFATTDGHAVISNGGHGINSYALTYGLNHRGLVVIAQAGWGGVYMDTDTQRAMVTALFAAVRALLDEPADPPPGWRLVCEVSDLRRYGACAWIRDGDPIRLDREDAEPAAKLVEALSLLRSGPPR
jgi:hypothetical protein